eukprot:COSAG01_NODE_5545_length_4192_cov_2.721231_4_plen_223_part_00
MQMKWAEPFRAAQSKKRASTESTASSRKQPVCASSHLVGAAPSLSVAHEHALNVLHRRKKPRFFVLVLDEVHVDKPRRWPRRRLVEADLRSSRSTSRSRAHRRRRNWRKLHPLARQGVRAAEASTTMPNAAGRTAKVVTMQRQRSRRRPRKRPSKQRNRRWQPSGPRQRAGLPSTATHQTLARYNLMYVAILPAGNIAVSCPIMILIDLRRSCSFLRSCATS